MSELPAGLFLALMALIFAPKACSAEELSATIIDSGSTNRAGFRIDVKQSAPAEMTIAKGRNLLSGEKPQHQQRSLAPALVHRFFDDLRAAAPLTSMPAAHCMKSASFGSTLIVQVGNEKSPDLSCGDGGRETTRNLIRDVHEIVAEFQSR